MPRRAVELLRQQTVELLHQTRDYADHLLQSTERPESLGRPSVVPRSCSVQAAGRKRRRDSPAQCATGGCFSAHLAMRRTPTQDMLPSLSVELRTHQLAGIKWLATLYSNSLSGVLADELQQDRQMQVIGLFAYLKNRGVGGPFLLVASSEALQSWMSQFHALLPHGLVAHLYNLGDEGSRDMLALLCSCPAALSSAPGQDPTAPVTRVVLMSHETFASEAHLICQQQFKHVVLDASGQAAPTRSLELAYSLAGRPKVLLLSAAHPAQQPGQHLQELWPLVRLVLPDSWETLYTAVTKLAEGIRALALPSYGEEVLPGVVGMLQDIVDQFVLRRTSEEVDLRHQRRDVRVCLYDHFA